MIGFYGLLTGSKARTEVLPLTITKGRPMYWSADIISRYQGQADMSYRLSTADKIST